MSYIDVTTEFQMPEFGHAWRVDERGRVSIHANIRLGRAGITVETPVEALQLATAALAAFRALKRLESDPALRQVMPAELDDMAPAMADLAADLAPVPGWASSETGERLLAPVGGPEDSRTWECGACGGRCIGERPLAGLCRGCEV